MLLKPGLQLLLKLTVNCGGDQFYYVFTFHLDNFLIVSNSSIGASL